MRTRDCDGETRTGRLRKAEQFYEAAITMTTVADQPAELADAIATLFVTAGIAAADVICCAEMKRYSAGEDHRSAVDLLAEADPSASRHLSRLLGMKSKAAYTHRSVSAAERAAAERAATALLERARSA